MSLSGGLTNISRALSGLAGVAGLAGDSGTYYHKNDSGFTCYFFWGSSTTAGVALGGLMNDLETVRITVPVGTSFSGLEPGIGDVLVTDDSKQWSVQNVVKLGLPSNPCAWALDLEREPELNRTNG
jgi:hypothetical protein